MKRVFYVALGIVLGCSGCVFDTGASRDGGMTSQRKVVKRCSLAQNENVKIWDNLRKYSFDYNGLKVEVQKLKGLEKVFVDVPVVGVSEIAQDGSVVVKLGHPGKDWNYSSPFFHPWMRVRFEKGATELAELDMWDRLTSVKVRFTGEVQGLEVDCVGIAYEITPPNDPLVGGNADTITGDELTQLIRESDGGLGRRQYAILQRRLAGRRLSFRSSHVVSIGIDRSSHLLSFEILASCPTYGGMVVTDGGTIIHMCPVKRRPLYARVRCADGGIIQRMAYVQSDPGLYVVEMSATVADPASVKRQYQHPDHPILVLENPEIRLNHDPEQFPDIDPRTVTGDELTRLFAKRKRAVPDRIVNQLGAALVDRDLAFHKLEVLKTPQPSPDGTETIFCKTANPSKCGIPIMVKVSLDRLNALPRAPIAGDSLLCVSGRVSQVIHHGGCDFNQSWIWLNAFSIEALRGKSKSPLEMWKGLFGNKDKP